MSATPAAPAPVMMEKAKEQLWLLKVPNFVMEHLQSVQEADVDLGTLTQDEEGAAAGGASSSSGSGRSFTLKLSDSAKLLPDVPRELSVTLGAPAAPMHVVSEPKETSKGGAWRLEGKIVQKGEAKPKTLTQEYKNMVARRVETANTKREIETWDDSSGSGPSYRQARPPPAPMPWPDWPQRSSQPAPPLPRRCCRAGEAHHEQGRSRRQEDARRHEATEDRREAGAAQVAPPNRLVPGCAQRAFGCALWLPVRLPVATAHHHPLQ